MDAEPCCDQRVSEVNLSSVCVRVEEVAGSNPVTPTGWAAYVCGVRRPGPFSFFTGGQAPRPPAGGASPPGPPRRWSASPGLRLVMDLGERGVAACAVWQGSLWVRERCRWLRLLGWAGVGVGLLVGLGGVVGSLAGLGFGVAGSLCDQC